MENMVSNITAEMNIGKPYKVDAHKMLTGSQRLYYWIYKSRVTNLLWECSQNLLLTVLNLSQ